MQESAKQKGVDACHLLFEECPRGKKFLPYSMLPSIRTVPVSGHLKQKLNF